MPCPFDKNRPCGSSVKLKNRYTKIELQKVAKECGIKNITSKTMDQLCKELRFKKQQQKQTPKPKLTPKASSIAYKQMMKKYKQMTKKHQQMVKKSKSIQHQFFTRPCGPRKSAKNPTAYSRPELEALAKKYNINDIKGKTIPQLCAELKTLIKKYSQQKKSQQKKSQQKILSIIKGKKTPPPIPKKPKKINQTSKNAYKPNYKLNQQTGQWKKIPKSGTYHYKYQLQDMTYDKVKQIAQNLKVDTNKQGSKQKIIQKILQVQFPLAKMPYNQKNKYIKKFKSILLSKLKKKKPIVLAKPPPSKTLKLQLPRLEVSKSVSSVLSKTPFTSGIELVNFFGYHNLLTHKKIIGADIDGLQSNAQWLGKQFEYQTQLPFLKKLIVLVYTYGGDTMIHAYLDKTFNINKAWTYEYETTYIHPLYPVILHLMISSPDEFIKTCVQYKPKSMETKQIIPLLDSIGLKQCKSLKVSTLSKGHEIFKNYRETLSLFFRNPPNPVGFFQPKFYEFLLDELIRETKSIIFRSPRLPHNLHVFKGLKSMDFMDFKDRNMYKNKRFISTSIDPVVSKRFAGGSCCFQKIYLLKNTSCMFISISYFREAEILLPPDRILYATSNQYQPLNNNVPQKATNMIVTN